MPRDEILVVFETNKVVTEQVLKDSIGLQRSDCVLITFDEVKKNYSLLKEYYAIVDGTTGNKIIEANKQNGSMLKENFIEFLLLKNGNFIIKAPNISQLTALHFDHSPRNEEMFKEAIGEYDNKINFLKNKNTNLRSKLDFEKSYKTGIILNDMMPSSNSNKIYKLIKSIPEKKEKNVEYITLEHLNIIQDIEKFLKYIK